MEYRLLRLTSVVWYSLFFGVIVPAALVAIGLTLDEQVLATLGVVLPVTAVSLAAAALFMAAALVLLATSAWTLHREGKGFPWSFGSHAAFNPQRLVTSGPFGVIRHPMASSYLLFLLGLGALVSSPTMLLWLVPLTAGLLYEYFEYSEELHLERWFGEAYVRYHEVTPSLVPRWRWRS